MKKSITAICLAFLLSQCASNSTSDERKLPDTVAFGCTDSLRDRAKMIDDLVKMGISREDAERGIADAERNKNRANAIAPVDPADTLPDKAGLIEQLKKDGFSDEDAKAAADKIERRGRE